MSNSPYKNTPEHPTPQRGRGILIFCVVLGIAGLGISLYLSHIHYATHTDPEYNSICAINDDFNCEDVARSPYSIFMGVPVSIWGILGYILITLFGTLSLTAHPRHPTWPRGILLALVAAAVVSSSALAFISFTRIDTLCIFCMSLYLINLMLLISMGALAVHTRVNPIDNIASDIVFLFKRPLLLAGLAVPILGATVGLLLAFTPYWHKPGWKDLPVLDHGVDVNGYHWIGAKDAPLTIVEFSDYQCPHCRRAHRDMRLKTAKFKGKIKLIHRHMPLDRACNPAFSKPFHEYACKFAKAVECAAEQKMFWAMNDAIFSVQNRVNPKDVKLELLGVELGLNRSEFRGCMSRPGYPEQIQKDLTAATEHNIAGTPTYFIGRKPYPGGIPSMVIQSALEQTQKNK